MDFFCILLVLVMANYNNNSRGLFHFFQHFHFISSTSVKVPDVCVKCFHF